jgi:4-amino-4-deoxy-L-arabinose transferase-like glycosyltransferase
VLAPLFVVSQEPPVIWGRALSALLATAAVGAVAALARLLFDERTALVAAAMAAVYPEAISLGAFVLSEAPFVPLMLLNLIAWTRAWQAGSRKELVGWSLAAGVCAGLATLMRPSWLLFVPFAAGVGLLALQNRARHSQIAAIIMLGGCITMSPWWIRNAQVAGRYVPTSLQVGASLYDGLSPVADGSSDMRFVAGFVRELQADEHDGPSSSLRLFEDRLDRRMRVESVGWTMDHPVKALQLARVKFLRMWSPLPNAAEFRSTTLRLVLAMTFTPVLLLALVGAWCYLRRDWPYLLLVLPAVYFTCLHVIFVSSIRYRQPAMMTLIILAARRRSDFQHHSLQRPDGTTARSCRDHNVLAADSSWLATELKRLVVMAVVGLILVAGKYYCFDRLDEIRGRLEASQHYRHRCSEGFRPRRRVRAFVLPCPVARKRCWPRWMSCSPRAIPACPTS